MEENTSNNTGTIVAGIEGGPHVVDGPLTTDIARKESTILVNEIDSRIVKVRPMATPIDQISRWAGTKQVGSQVVDYYSVDTKPTVATITEGHTEPSAADVTADAQLATLHTSADNIFEPSETILVKDITGYEPDGVTPSSNSLVLYVLAKAPDATLTVQAVNGKKIGSIPDCVPSIPRGTSLIRMGRAAAELDVQTAQFESLPIKEQQYCQIFKVQIEQSTLQKIANKEVRWSFTDQEEAAIYDMRLGMEKSFLFGARRRIYDRRKKEDVLLTGGIWFQAGKQFAYEPEALDEATLIALMREAFTGNAGSHRKLLIGGSAFIERLSNIATTKVTIGTDTVTKWGIDFTEMHSKFGTMYVLLSEIFDECGMSDNAIVVDPAYLQKYSHIPFSTEELNLKAAGVRNTDALVLTEASCLVLRYPKAHMRIVTA